MTLLVPDPENRPALKITTACVPDDGALQAFGREMQRCLHGDRRIIASLPRHMYRAFARFGALRMYVWAESNLVFSTNPRFHSMMRTSLDATKQAGQQVDVSKVDAIDYVWCMRPYDNRKKTTPVSPASFDDAESGCAVGIVGHRQAWALLGPVELEIERGPGQCPDVLSNAMRAVRDNRSTARFSPYLHIRVAHLSSPETVRAYVCLRGMPILEGARYASLSDETLIEEVLGAPCPAAEQSLSPSSIGAHLQALVDASRATPPLETGAGLDRVTRWALSAKYGKIEGALDDVHKGLRKALRRAAKAGRSRRAPDDVSLFSQCLALAALLEVESRQGGLEESGIKGASRSTWGSLVEQVLEQRDTGAAGVLLAAVADTNVEPRGLSGDCEKLVMLLLAGQERDPVRLDTCGTWGAREMDAPQGVVLGTAAAVRGLSHMRRCDAVQTDDGRLDEAIALGTRAVAMMLLDLTSRGARLDAEQHGLPVLVQLVESLVVGLQVKRTEQRVLTELTFDGVRFDFAYGKYELVDVATNLDILPAPEPSRLRPANHFRLLASNVNIQPMVEQLEERAAYWQFDTSRQKNTQEQRFTETIYLRGGIKEPGIPVEDVHGVRYTKSTAAFPAITEWVQRFADAMDADVGRMLVARLKGEQQVYPHYDSGQYACFWTRFHLVLGTEGSIMRSGDEEYLFQTGDLFWFDNEAVHVAYNTGESWRTHLIFDIKQRGLGLPPDAKYAVPERRGEVLPPPAIPLHTFGQNATR